MARDVTAAIVVRRSAEPLSAGFSRATRRGGLLVCSGRAAHETTLASFEGRQGARHLYGEVQCDALEQLQRRALDRPRPELVVKVDRSGLNEHHPIVKDLYAAIDRVLTPIVAAEERRAGAHRITAARAVTDRDQVGLRALNDLLKSAFDQPGTAALQRGASESSKPPLTIEGDAEPEQSDAGSKPGSDGSVPEAPRVVSALRFKQSPIRLHPGEQRTVTLLADPMRVPPGTAIEFESDSGLTVSASKRAIPEPGARGNSAAQAAVRAKVTVEPGSRLVVRASAGESTAELEILIVRHHASGWVREIARKNDDQTTEAEFDPETGVVTVYEGRREFRALERAARHAGYSKRRVPEYVPYRMLEVEAAANAVYAWAAEQILAGRLPEERPTDPADYAAAVRHEAQMLRHRAHHKLMQAFLEPEIFEGAVTITRRASAKHDGQLRLVDGESAGLWNLAPVALHAREGTLEHSIELGCDSLEIAVRNVTVLLGIIVS